MSSDREPEALKSIAKGDADERAVAGDVAEAGCVRVDVAGAATHGEDGTLGTCEKLVEHLNSTGQAYWGPPRLSNNQHTDAIAEGVGEFAGRELKIQVVRAVVDNHFWTRLSQTGRASMLVSLEEAAGFLKEAIEKKLERIPAADRTDLTLALNAIAVPAVSLDIVIDTFNTLHGAWVEQLGFASVWVVGPGADRVSRLGKNSA